MDVRWAEPYSVLGFYHVSSVRLPSHPKRQALFAAFSLMRKLTLRLSSFPKTKVLVNYGTEV